VVSRAYNLLVVATLTALLGVGASITVRVLEWEQSLGLAWLFTARGPIEPPPGVAVVGIDRDTARSLGVSTEVDEWPRTLHADLIDVLAQAGATAIALDIIFEEPRASSEDARLAEAIRAAGNVVLLDSMDRSFPTNGEPEATQLVLDTRAHPIPILRQAAVASVPFPLPVVPIRVDQFWAFVPAAGDAPTLPSAALEIAGESQLDHLAALLASVDPALRFGKTDPAESLEARSRRYRRLFNSDSSLGARALRQLYRNGPGDDGAETVAALIRNYSAPDNRYLNYYGPPRRIPFYGYHDAMQWTAEEARIAVEGKVIFVGYNENLQPQQQDTFYSVYSQRSGLNLSGVEIAATAYANLIDGRPIRPLSIPMHLSVIALWGILIGTCATLFGSVRSAFLALAAAPVYLVLVYLQFATNGSWWPTVVPLLVQTPFAVAGAVLLGYAQVRAQKDRARLALGLYLPQHLVDQLAEADLDIRSDTQIIEGTCLSTDAAAYTSLSERIPPKELAELMNEYYGVLFKAVRKNGGIVSDVVGDSMVAHWAAGASDTDLHAAPCRAALEIVIGGDSFRGSDGERILVTRVGLHHGELAIGTIGAENHYEYRAVGDIVNTSSRIQELNKRLGTRVLASSQALGEDGEFLTRELGAFQLFGKSTPIQVHEVLPRQGGEAAQQQDLIAIFGEALNEFRRRNWSRAESLFSTLVARFDNDGPARFYLQLCSLYRQSEPAPDWDGRIELTTK
jgi:adenylate cyclase